MGGGTVCSPVHSQGRQGRSGVTCGYGGQSGADGQRGWLYVGSGTKHEVVVPEVDASPLDVAGGQQVLPGRQLHTCHWRPQLHHLHICPAFGGNGRKSKKPECFAPKTPIYQFNLGIVCWSLVIKVKGRRSTMHAQPGAG